MKKELPIAACLLALGVALCWNVGNPLRSQASAENSLGQTTAAVLAEGTSDVTAEPAAGFLNILQAAGGKQDLWCKSTLVSTGQALNRLPSIATRTQLACRLYDMELLARGKYFQTENGQKSRLELIFDDSLSPLSILQICDGQFSYTLRSGGKQQRLEFVDLGRLENKDAGLSAVALPASWVMGGGIGATLIHYAEAFHFQAIDINDPERLHVRGVWDTRVLANLLYSIDDELPQERPTEVEWDNLPAHMPHGIELTFSKLTGEVMQPETITLFQFAKGQGRAIATPMMIIEFDTFEVPNALPPALFTIESNGFEAVEVTDVYNEKIRELSVGLPQVAVAPNDVEQHAR